MEELYGNGHRSTIKMNRKPFYLHHLGGTQSIIGGKVVY